MVDYNIALAFIQKYHTGQKRAGDVPTWHHLVRVSLLLQTVLERYKEGEKTERSIVALSALGHDILEDTEVAKDEVQEVFGDRGLELIIGMTNELGDKDVEPYVKKMVQAEESVRLIKLADLYDNISNVTYCLFTLGPKWTHGYFLPIVTPMYQAIKKTEFHTYRNTGEELQKMVEVAFFLLQSELGRY